MKLHIKIMIKVLLTFWISLSMYGCQTGLQIEGDKSRNFGKCEERPESVPVKVSVVKPNEVDKGLIIKGSAPSYIVLRWRKKGSNDEWNAMSVQKQEALYSTMIPIPEAPQEYEYKIEVDTEIAESRGKGAGLSEPYTLNIDCQERCKVLVKPGDIKLPHGQPLKVEAIRQDSMCNEPLKIEIRKRQVTGEWSNEWSQVESMTALGDNDHAYVYIFEENEEDFQYRISNTEADGSPYTVIVDQYGQAYNDGYESGHKFLSEDIQIHRLIIKLYSLSFSDREQFLQGFKAAYDQANYCATGEKYENLLRQSVEGGTYEQALAWGEKHVSGQASNSLVRDMIRNSRSLSRGFKLGWQAGYIEGFVKEMLDRMPVGQDNEPLYEQAKDMYDSLSWIVE